ncbi:hypothetical protein D3C86_2182040 [compost metagenome]
MTPAMLPKYSPARWPVLPLPAEPKVRLPGLALAAAISSAMLRALSLWLPTTIMGRWATSEIGVKSLRVS